jgi:hypothetical protein
MDPNPITLFVARSSGFLKELSFGPLAFGMSGAASWLVTTLAGPRRR